VSEAGISVIRLDGSEIFLMSQSGKFVWESSQTLMAFHSFEDARTAYKSLERAAYPYSKAPRASVDLDAVLTWCSKPHPKPIESVDQSDEFWYIIEFLDELEEEGLLDDEALQALRLANDAANKFLYARLSTIASVADLSVEESTRVQAMFELGISALRRALPE
jgi:hypothetical protein